MPPINVPVLRMRGPGLSILDDIGVLSELVGGFQWSSLGRLVAVFYGIVRQWVGVYVLIFFTDQD